MPSETMTPEANEKPSFLGKAWNATKNFVKGAITAVPMTILVTGLTFGGSALMGYVTGGAINPLHVESFTKEIALRMFGMVMLGSGISGVVHSVKTMQGETPTATAAPHAPTSAAACEKDPEVCYDMAPAMTPKGHTMHTQKPRAQPTAHI